MKIAMIGTRGVPANYGGFETCVEEVGKRLVEKGHNVTVYCRKNYYKKSVRQDKYKGMNLIYLPNIKTKSLDTLSHTFISVIHSIFKKYDIYMVFNIANAFLLFPLKFLGKKIIINTDGLEWRRSKWGQIAKIFYKYSEKISVLVTKNLISDSIGIYKYYKKYYYIKSTIIAYGAYPYYSDTKEYLNELNIMPNKYFLQITRFEKENNPLLTIKSFNLFSKTNPEYKLIIIGGVPYSSNYYNKIIEESNKNQNVILFDSIYDSNKLNQLRKHCIAYIHGNEVGGTNPALLEAMACGCFIIYRNVIFNRSILGKNGIHYVKRVDSLMNKMQWTVNNLDKLESYKNEALKIIRNYYNWNIVSNKYEKLFKEINRDGLPISHLDYKRLRLE